MKDLATFAGELDSIDSTLPHASNLKAKCKNALRSGNAIEQNFLCESIEKYLEIRSKILEGHINTKEWINTVVSSMEEYASILKSKGKIFSHQSDFLSSILPEALHSIISRVMSETAPEYKVASQGQIIIECAFLPNQFNPIHLKRKRVDVAVLLPTSMIINEKKLEDFCIPVAALEVKTNLDKNMIAGIEHSAESFKKTFPLCRYFVVSEYADFAVETQNYASSFIDEIFILRKAKRAVGRKGGILPTVDAELIHELIKDVRFHVQRNQLERTALKLRMTRGRLIKHEQQ